jgi:hypothetical protein
MIIKRGIYRTTDGHQAIIERDGTQGGCLALVLHVGFVGYDGHGKCVNEEAPEGLTLDVTSWQPKPERE